MLKLVAVGLAIVASHQPLTRPYWWPARETCVIVVGVRRGVFIVGNVPQVKCTIAPAGWHSTPPPPYA